MGYFVPKYPKKGQKYTKSENTPGIPNGVFNPGYFLSFLRSVLQKLEGIMLDLSIICNRVTGFYTNLSD